MQAVVYTEYGPPDVLRLAEVETPTPQADEILVKIRARPVNFGDLLARKFNTTSPRSFTMPAPFWFPARLSIGWNRPRRTILGSEFAGDVVGVGQDVTRFKVGDAVYGYRGMNFGAYAEYLAVPETSSIAHKPANLDYDEASTVPYGAIMALNLLKKGNIQPGHKVLINGASGSIGSYALQLAKHYGAEVTGVCGTPRVDFVRALGADHVIDYTQHDFTASGETYDLIMDVLGKSSWARSKRVLAPDGRYLLVSFKMKHLFLMLWTGLTSRQKLICAMSGESAADLEQMKDLIEAGKVTTVIDRRFPLAEAAEAHRYVETGRKQGHVVITSHPAADA